MAVSLPIQLPIQSWAAVNLHIYICVCVYTVNSVKTELLEFEQQADLCVSCVQACPPPVAANYTELLPCCQGCMGGAGLYSSRKSEEELSLRYSASPDDIFCRLK